MYIHIYIYMCVCVCVCVDSLFSLFLSFFLSSSPSINIYVYT